MKVSRNIPKRCLAMVMALAVLFSCGNAGGLIHQHAHAAEHEPANPSITLGNILAGNYELSDVEKEVLNSGDLSAEIKFEYTLPPEEATDESHLVSINREQKTIAVADFVDAEGNTWIPKQILIKANNATVETLALTAGECTYTYDGSAFAVVVEYVLTGGSLKESITNAQQLALLNAVLYLAEDVDYMQMIDRDTFAEMSGISLTPNSFLDTMTVVNPLLGDTPINLVYSLVQGYTKSVTLPGDTEATNISIKLEGNAAAAAQSLKAQQDANGQLDLPYFMKTHACSYLELLYNDSYRAGLENALDQNISDVSGLLAAGGLNDIYADILELKNTTLPALEARIYGMINDQMPAITAALGTINGVDGDVDTLAEVEAIQAAVEQFYQDSLDYANGLIGDKVASGEMDASWVPVGGIQGAADLKELMDNVQTAYNTGLAQINALLRLYGVQYGITFPSVTCADDIDTKIKPLLLTAKAQIETQVADSLAELNAGLSLYGYSGTVTGSADIDAAIDYMNNNAEAYIWAQINSNLPAGSVNSVEQVNTAKQALRVAQMMGRITSAQYNLAVTLLDNAVTAVQSIPTVVAGMTTAKTSLKQAETALANIDLALTKLEEGKAQLQKAEAALALLDGYYQQLLDAEQKMALLDEAVAGLSELEEYKALLDQYAGYLPTLIDMLEDFGTAVQPVADRFDADQWQVKNHVIGGADFDDLTDCAEEMIGAAFYTDADLKAADQLVVAQANTQYNMSMYTVSVIYKASIVNPALLDSDELYALINYQPAEKITMESGASKAQVLQAIAAAGYEADALNSWRNYQINATNFVRTETALPDTLTQNITYIVEYTPKTLTVSYEGMTGPATVLYGHRMTLPVCQDDSREYTYTVNGADYYQGQVVTLKQNVTIVCTEGDKSADRDLLDLVINATSVRGDIKKILASSALVYTDSVKIRFPSAALLNVNSAAGILTANQYANAIGNKAWTAQSAVTKDLNGNVLEYLNSFVNDQASFDRDFAIAEVLYQITFNASDAKTTDAKILAAMNFANTLVDEYVAQKSALDYLSSDTFMRALAMLDGRDPTITGYLSMAQTAMATDSAKPALDTIINDLNQSSNGKLTLYNLLFNYKEQGMSYYYKNEALIRNEIAKMQNAMKTLTSSEKFMGVVKANDQTLHDRLLGIKDDLLATNVPAKNSKILTSNDAALKQLIADLDAYAQAGKTVYNTVGELKWTTTLSATVGVKIVTVNVQWGTQSAALKLTFTEGEALTAADIQNMLSKLGVLETEMGIDKLHYTCQGLLPQVGDVMSGNLTEQDLTYNLVWTPKTYDIIAGGNVIGSVTYDDPYFVLPSHSDPEYRYDYVIGGVTYAQGDSVNLGSNFDALFASGSLTVERREIDKVREQMITFVDRMKGAVTLIEHGHRQYSLVLNINTDTITSDMSNFVMGMLMSGYGYIGMDGQMFYGAPDADSLAQFHLQTVIDMIMNSGMGTQTILDMYGANGFIDLPLNGTIISANGGNINALGGKLLQTTMSFGTSDADAVAVDFYITLPDNKLLQAANKALELSRGVIEIAFQNGRLETNVNLPEPVYASYLAALLMAGKTDLHNLDQINAEIAFGYLFSLIDPLIGEEDVSTETFENTIALFGKDVDLSRFSNAYEKMQAIFKALEARRSYTDAGCQLTFNNIPINRVVNWVQNNVVGKLAASFGVNPDDIQLSTMIYEYRDASDEDYGLDIKLYAGLNNLNIDYAAMFIDVRGNGLTKKVGLLTASEIAAGALAEMNGPAIVILLSDINSNVVLNGATFVDLNGKTINGTLTANATTILTDNFYLDAEPGGVTGKVSGNVTIIDGVYGTDVSKFLLSGYEQLPNGAVTNKLYTITSDSVNNITVTIHTNASSLKELANLKSAGSLGLDIALDLMLNHYNMAALYIGADDGALCKIFDIRFDDILKLIAGENRLTNGINTIFNHTSLSDLADLFNAVTDDLTDFAALEAALKSDGVIATYRFETAAWQFELEHIEDGDYMSLVFGSSDERQSGSVTIAIDGGLTDDLAILLGALADTVTVESELDFDELQIDGNGVLDLVGSYKGSIDVDFTVDRNYVIMMAVILAHGKSSVRNDMVDAIVAYYDSNETSLAELERCFKNLSVDDITDALANTSRTVSFKKMVRDLGLQGIVDEEIGNDRMGYGKVIDLMGIALRALKSRGLLDSIFSSGRKLGSFEKTDALGNYFGFSVDADSSRYAGPFKGYSLGYDLDLSELSIKVRLFAEENLVIVTNASGVKIGTFDNLDEAFALANANPGSTVTVAGGVIAENDLEVSTDITLLGVKRITFANGAKLLLKGADAKLTADKAIDGNVTVADVSAYCMTITADGKYTVYALNAHFDSATDNDHVCDYGCGTVLESCVDPEGDGDHNCDICGEKINLCADNDNDHICDECGTVISLCVDNDGDHACDICGKIISLCTHQDNNTDHICDLCGMAISVCTDPAGDGDHNCDICGAVVGLCADANNDHICDECGLVISVCTDTDNDHNCDICGKVVSLCSDADNDHACDICGKIISLCTDGADADHECDICGALIENCYDNNNNHFCDECGEKISLCADVDGDGDHNCDICGAVISLCADNDNDHACDECGNIISLCVDSDNDGYCDICGADVDSLCSHNDANNDHRCDICDAVLTVCKDTVGDGNHNCDICGEKIDLCADNDNDHICDECANIISLCADVDGDGDHNCDICGAVMGLCKDTDNDHLCDECGNAVSLCSDAVGDGDHACDICGAVMGLCADNNNDHFCDECGIVISLCTDAAGDGNHNCDICGAVMGLCADNNNDHNCDECGIVISVCVDNDRNGACDICGSNMDVICIHADNDNDHLCDVCGTVISVCKDLNSDHNCDICSKVISLCVDGTDADHNCDICGDLIENCYDLNNDHFCDECGVRVSLCVDVDGDGDHNCDICGAVISLCADNDNDHACDECGNIISLCVDSDNDGYCDICGADLNPACQHVDADNDHLCDDCGSVISLCADNNNDHACDICGEIISLCVDSNNDHVCDICGATVSLCADNNNDHLCDICGAVISLCSDAAGDGDHNCDICGDLIETCFDNDNDHLCDECGTVISLCIDNDRDGYCDICGGQISTVCQHVDANNDHICDECGITISVCTDAAGDGDHNCDICGAVVGLCADSNNDHFCDECGNRTSLCSDVAGDGDHNCDICGAVIGLCADNDNDHTCDECGTVISLCVDSDNDGYCDICGADLDPSCSHVDANNDHNCDICGNVISLCTDAAGDGDHNCDICGKVVSLCADNDSDHACDECGNIISLCVDNDNDGCCDICGATVGLCNHKDLNNDHVCDICGTVISLCADAAGDGDHNCDICGKVVSLCADNDNDHACDECGTVISVCVDNDNDGCCDICGADLDPSCSHADANNDHACDICGEVISLCVDAVGDGNHNCDICGAVISLCADNDNDHACDECGTVISVCVDNDNDGYCDICGADLDPSCSHVDANNDHNCDICGNVISLCADNNNDHACDVCGAVISLCADADNDHVCDICGAVISLCSDAAGDGDHLCDICGKVVSLCADADNDHACDECGTVISVCVDNDNDGYCDICGADLDPSCSHADANNDHLCDECGSVISLCSDAAGDGDHNCDICGKTMGLCADNNNDHVCDECGLMISVCTDTDNDHLCDICGKVVSVCVDADNDHACDICGNVISLCTDADNDGDHNCDICGAVMGLCADNDNDHLCDECGSTVSLCSDAAGDGDHLCDICGKVVNLCSDNDSDHICDECGLVVSICVDNDNDGYCDICGTEINMSCAHEDYNHDHVCDLCGLTISVCSDADNDGDHHCDICGETIGTCSDGNNDHICDECGLVISVCTDAAGDGDHNCDICGAVIENCNDSNNDHICDECGNVISICTDTTGDGDHNCDICGAVIGLCADTNNDHICDECGNVISVCTDAAGDGDHVCDICGKVVNLCADANNDHVCDECGTVLSVCIDRNQDGKCDICGSDISTACRHTDANRDHLCDKCHEVISACVDTDRNHACDICGKSVSDCVDADSDHACEVCGQIVSSCVDTDKDHNCDICGKTVSLCADRNRDHFCDQCGKRTSLCIDPVGDFDHVCDICGTVIGQCADDNNDHVCDECGTVISLCADADNDGDHNCDICGAVIGVCADNNNDHICDECGTVISLCTDTDKDHVCNICGGNVGDHVDYNYDHICDYGCDKTFGDHTDANKDHACDYGCSKLIGDHTDSNFDHICDYGCSNPFGDHTDANKDHVCDYGCSDAIGNHADSNFDHICDYGCSDPINVDKHVDANKDHKCDYGCDIAIGEHTDADFNHICDYGCSELMGVDKHVDANKDHKCDYGCSVPFGNHADADKNHICDYGCLDPINVDKHVDLNKDHICDYGCDIAIGDHADADFDHICDYGCSDLIGTDKHVDVNKDHVCDYGCSEAIGDHVDNDKDHVCDYGCSETIGDHVDANKDHFCDYGCSEVIGNHADNNFDHVCDYGCAESFGNHVDANKDHICDYGCSESIGDHVDNNKDHVCDYGCDVAIGDHADLDHDHYCDYCGAQLSTHVDNIEDGKCDICDEQLVPLPTIGSPIVTIGNKILSYQVDRTNKILYLDAHKNGVTVAELEALLEATVVTGDADGKVAIKIVNKDNNQLISTDLVPTGAKITLIASNIAGEVTAEYDIVVVGDVNCNGKIENNDAVLISLHYLGQKTLTGLALDAADVNRNGKLENNDAVLISVKYVNPEKYQSRLIFDRMG